MSSSNNNPSKKFAWYQSICAKVDRDERKNGRPGAGGSREPNLNAGRNFLAPLPPVKKDEDKK